LGRGGEKVGGTPGESVGGFGGDLTVAGVDVAIEERVQLPMTLAEDACLLEERSDAMARLLETQTYHKLLPAMSMNEIPMTSLSSFATSQ